MYCRGQSALCVLVLSLFVSSSGFGQCPDPVPGHPQDLLRGEAPIVFTQGNAGSLLLDGTPANTDDIILWVPDVGIIIGCNSNLVLLGEVGQFFKLWDSGPVAGPNGNDDDANEMRTLHFDAADGSFLIGYDDATTMGFSAPFDAILDGALHRMTPTGLTDGFINSWTFELVYDEGVIGTPGVLTDADLWGLGVVDDGTLHWGGGSVTLNNDQATTTFKNSNDLAHTEGLAVASPRHIGETIFFEGNAQAANESQLSGQLRGVDVLDSGEILVSVSQMFEHGDGVSTQLVLERWDIGALDPVTRQAELVYPGELFFDTISTATAEMLDFTVLDTPEEINAMIESLGPTSTPSLALRRFADPPPAPPANTMLLTNVAFDGQPTAIRSLDLSNGLILGTFVDGDFDNNGNLWPVEDIMAGPDRTVLVAQPGGDGKIGQYDESGAFLGNFIGGQPVQANNPVDNIRGMARSADGAFLFTADWTGDNIHRFDFATGAPAPIAGDPLGEFIPGTLPPPDLDQPQSLEVLANGELLVADIAQGKLLRFDSTTGNLIGEFVANPLDDIVGNVTDIDVQSNGDVIVAERGSGGAIKRFDAGGVLLNSFAFTGPEGVHLLASGDYLVATGSTLGSGQGIGLFRVSPTGVILETIDNSRSYGVLELVTLVSDSGIPTVSHWGLLVLAMLLLAAATIVFGRWAKREVYCQ